MPIDVLKMDKSFVDDLSSGDQRTALAGTIAGLARTLSMTVVAEGIERPEQADMLHAMQCELGQAQGGAPYYVVAGELVRYKRVDLAIEAANRLQRRLIALRGRQPSASDAKQRQQIAHDRSGT
jgi:predicted signal transduction protein with EAL and GGDEF domain